MFRHFRLSLNLILYNSLYRAVDIYLMPPPRLSFDTIQMHCRIIYYSH